MTYAARLERRDSRMDWSRPAATLHNQVRGLHPWPLAAAMLKGQRVQLLKAAVDATPVTAAPGHIISANHSGIVVATGNGALRILVVKPENRKPMDVGAFLNGAHVQPGDRFEPLPAIETGPGA